MAENAGANAEENAGGEFDRRGRRVTAARTRARRLTRAEGGRPYVVTVRLSAAEFEAISARAIVAGVSRQRLMVEAAVVNAGDTGRPAMTRSERNGLLSEFFAVRRIVGGLARNLNQLAVAANATGEVPAELAPTAAAIQRSLERLQAAIDALQ